mmetsp:Transcript_9072/g.8827  ORF Transcript_9072/g.8827 Transcript_9072/m.8827 type:complete len:155 (+) Transcript_9072:1-465(+)
MYSFVEFYSNVTKYSTICEESGILIDTDTVDIKSSVSQYDGYNLEHEPKDQDECFPRTKNGRIAAVLFMFKNPFFDEPTDMTIWNPPTTKDDTNDDNDGSFQFCVRVGYKRGVSGSIRLISFLDTKVTVNVNLVGKFNSFIQSEPITIEQATSP